MFSLEDHAPVSGINRREWLRIGGLGALGLSLPQLLHAGEQPAPRVAPEFGAACKEPHSDGRRM